MSTHWPEAPHKAVMVLEYTDPDHDVFFKVMDEIRAVLRGNEGVEPTMVHVAVHETAEDVLRVFNSPEITKKAREAREKEQEMGIVKHGEGSVIPESDQQKTVVASGEGMTSEAAAELQRENEEADRSDDVVDGG